MTDKEIVLVEILIAAPAEEVWRTLREPDEIARWFGWKYPGLKDEIDMIFLGGMTVDASARRLEIPHTGDVFTLEPRGNQTIVRLIRAAPATGSWDDIYDDIVEGWTTFLYQLRFTLERHPRDERRTIYLNGRARAAADPDPIDALGLGELASVPAGQPFELRLATGDTIHGSVWFRTKHQFGVSVDELGDGLIVAARRPANERSPHGSGFVVVTLYGLGDAEFEAWRARWHSWWAGAFELIEAHPAEAGV
jgi:hypothetical protein